jgi:RHS repeat-associated protein
MTGTVETYTSFPFGDALTPATGGSSPDHFTGKERDIEDNLDYFGARYYASNLGRFMSSDPVATSRDISDPQSLNKYSYAFNRPTVLTDPDGRWPEWYHHIIIENNFSNLGAHAVSILEAASDWVDSLEAGNHAPERSFMHAMRDGAHNQSVQDAERQTNNYIDNELQAAVADQITYESNGGRGYSDDALAHFGHALHTATDRTSPEHAGYQPWYCLVCPSAYKHRRDEERSARSADNADEEARYEAQMAAAQLWQQYQGELATEREKQREKRKHKQGISSMK